MTYAEQKHVKRTNILSICYSFEQKYKFSSRFCILNPFFQVAVQLLLKHSVHSESQIKLQDFQLGLREEIFSKLRGKKNAFPVFLKHRRMRCLKLILLNYLGKKIFSLGTEGRKFSQVMEEKMFCPFFSKHSFLLFEELAVAVSSRE